MRSLLSFTLSIILLASCQDPIGDYRGTGTPIKDTVTFDLPWSGSLLKIGFAGTIHNPTVDRWQHPDSVRITAVIQGETFGFDTLRFGYLRTSDTTLTILVTEMSKADKNGSATVETSPPPAYILEAFVNVTAHKGINVRTW